ADIELAAALVLAHRATQLPAPEDTQERPAPPAPDMSEPDQTDTDTPQSDAFPETDMLIEAVATLLPAGLLQTLSAQNMSRRASGAGAGQKRASNRRGQPLPPRPGRLDGTRRIDLVATLRTAAPWQPIRRARRPDAKGLIIHPSDIRVKRYVQHSDRVLIFCVDASGSSAVARLGEAKGAIELLLAEAYANRDHVALVGFRGTGAELLLPPTRSLVQTKRRLAALPGGGGTPLASGLHSAQVLADQTRGKGLSPTLVLLTDGRANIALDGAADRKRAAEDASQVANAIRAQGTRALVIDTSNRPQPALQDLGRSLDATYVPLPRADARHVSQTVNMVLNG
ncbi:MAG: VWA domain-containing protein, partial [Pseudomonadota bacterium]